MLETKLIFPYLAKPTHHLIYGKFQAVQESAKQETPIQKPVVLFGESLYIYDGHHHIMDARLKKSDIPAYIIKSEQDFLQLPKGFWNPELSPEKYSYEDVLKILESASLADDEVFN